MSAGGIAAWELQKFEQEHSEIYLYDLGGCQSAPLRGNRHGLDGRINERCPARGASVIFMQADTAADDAPAISLYEKLGVREYVLHFAIGVKGKSTFSR